MKCRLLWNYLNYLKLDSGFIFKIFTLLLQGRIESEVWAGVNKGCEILEENFKNADRSSNNDVAPTKKPRNSSTKKSQQGNTTANINLYPDSWKVRFMSSTSNFKTKSQN